ncbi:uncharacterized protein LOC122063269 [Macadamia integrifolia]|uniref:uncharacterized protein LOC122063269 n=1 Tax=Macadamia integrifolia TaxID=60698 RepID=UPI001C50061F|nr:uncharacterized protein LOC122063269 [Macadamia integrifolia]
MPAQSTITALMHANPPFTEPSTSQDDSATTTLMPAIPPNDSPPQIATSINVSKPKKKLPPRSTRSATVSKHSTRSFLVGPPNVSATPQAPQTKEYQRRKGKFSASSQQQLNPSSPEQLPPPPILHHDPLVNLEYPRSASGKLGGVPIDPGSVEAFNNCLDNINMNDLRWSDANLTWQNRRSGADRIACKLDRALVNEAWPTHYPASFATFDAPTISDHCPISLHAYPSSSFGPKPFKFFDMWTLHLNFSSIVYDAWNLPVKAFSSPLIALSKKLENVKSALKL